LTAKLKYRSILFDFDGTLADTNELIIHSFLHTLEQFFPHKYQREDIIRHMGKTLWEMMEIYGPEHVDELVKFYREYNVKVHDHYIREFPEVNEVIKELATLGVKMGIVSTKQRKTIEMGLNKLDLTPYFSTVVTYHDTEKHKPDPEPIFLAMKSLNAIQEETIYVGDSTVDILAAKNAGIKSVGVSWSLRFEELKNLNPDYILNSMRDLLKIVKEV